MNMIHKVYECEVPAEYHDGYFDRQFKVSAWQAMGSDQVNMRTWDKSFGWSKDWPEDGITGVITEKLSDYASRGIRTMDDLINFLFYVKA